MKNEKSIWPFGDIVSDTKEEAAFGQLLPFTLTMEIRLLPYQNLMIHLGKPFHFLDSSSLPCIR